MSKEELNLFKRMQEEVKKNMVESITTISVNLGLLSEALERYLERGKI